MGIGPEHRVLELFGDKVQARQLAESLSIPTIPGSKDALDSVGAAKEVAQAIGYPIMLKASSGGGGRGMRAVANEREMEEAFERCASEAKSSFGDERLFLEKLIERPRHIEIQILADRSGNVVHLGERDCSVQRRHQKLLEESPSPAINHSLRKKMGNAAIAAAKSISYEGAGTVEFLVDDDNNFYFMEMNTRIQVEHPVTEMVTGVDLIAEQIKIAGGDNLEFTQDDIQLNGHAIECRINAVDPSHNFRPSPGKITGWLPPGGPGVRVDSHVYTGYEIPPFYDSLIGKLIVWGKDRNTAIKRMNRALNECAITGIPTTINFHLNLLNKTKFIEGKIYTKYVEEELLSN